MCFRKSEISVSLCERFIFHLFTNYYLFTVLKQTRLDELNNFENIYFKLKSELSNSVNLRELLYLLFLLSSSNSKPGLTLLNSSNTVKKLMIAQSTDFDKDEKSKNDIHLRKHSSSIVRPHTIHGDINSDYRITSKYSLLAKDLVFIFQGISGKHINFNENEKFLFNMEKNDLFFANDVHFAKRLSVLGQNFKSIQHYSDFMMNNYLKGLVCQSFGSALNEEILDFYKLITGIQANYHQKSHSNTDVTLHKLYIWTYETSIKFEALKNLIHKSRTKKGGALISVVYDYMHQGDPIIRECVRKILSKIVKPIRQILNHWIFYGELKDEFKEFFIGLNENAHQSNDFWFDKYSINKSMLPGFISKQQAYMILITGKAISMLREVSQNKVTIILPVYDQLKHSLENSNLETLFEKKYNSNANDFASLLEYVYKEISKTALSILSARYVLSDHFQAHKKYLLFEQSDFIYYLMELLHPLLDRPANKLRLYTLSQTLENAIRKTSAQYESGETISRLDIYFDQNFQHENGWDIFTFKYRIDGPISTIFTEQCQCIYTRIFSLFWKIKRMDFILNKCWIDLKLQNREFTTISFKTIFNNFYYVMYQITAYIKTMQRYFNYLVESGWNQVINELNEPRNLDKLIKTHQLFLQTLVKKLFFGHSQSLTKQYEVIASHIFDFIEKLNQFLKELNSFRFKQLKDAWQDELAECENEIDSNYNFWLINFNKMLHKEVVLFLELLVETEEDDLQELCFSIDFNRFYKMNHI